MCVMLLLYEFVTFNLKQFFHRIIRLGSNFNVSRILLFDFSLFARSIQCYTWSILLHMCPCNYPSFCHIHCRIYCHIYGVAISRRWAVTKLAVFPADHCSNNSSCPWSQSLAGSFKQFIQIVSEQTRNSFTEKKSYYFLFCYFILVTP